MSGPYMGGLGKRQRSSKTESSEDENNGIFFSENDEQRKNVKRRHVAPRDAEVIPKFRPEDSNSNVMGWLHKIDQLGDIYGWDDTDRIFIMQLRLRGSARDWYEDLEEYNMSWEEWKNTLHTAFPRSTDYADKLERMLARTKEDKETMTKYYHEKLSLLRKCNIYGENAISCIIRGLPLELRANAKAYSCETPEQLYYGYLSALENLKPVVSTSTRRSSWVRGNAVQWNFNGTSTVQQQPKNCYVCRRPGHEAKDCRQQQRCENCRRNGHTTATCWFAPSSSRHQQQKEFASTTGNRSEDRGTRSTQDGRVLTTTGNTRRI
ncbi:uncharacterized protein LOC126912890 [Spodoptera frugiperda]|uniref:Uncharacterized protein LOC126912890 n=1 Tax=Spodoptera frugiperda TaxID=7108 RepID=A0A9R0F737_SPOFR|nr:uncharacterized protein LOC126912890 [Spodoptera frugiperda]